MFPLKVWRVSLMIQINANLIRPLSVPARFKHRHAPWAGEQRDRTAPLPSRMPGLSRAASQHAPPSPAQRPSQFPLVARWCGHLRQARSQTHRDGSGAQSPWVLLPGEVFPQMQSWDGGGSRQRGSPGCCVPTAASARRAGTVALAADTSAGWEGLEFGILFFWRGAVGAKNLIN